MRRVGKPVVLNLNLVVAPLLRQNPLSARDAAVLESRHFKPAASARTRNTVPRTARRMTGRAISRNAFERHNKLSLFFFFSLAFHSSTLTTVL